MKIILISPYPDLQSFGLRTISACLKREGHEVCLLFLPKRFTERYKKKTLNEIVELSRGIDLIGISLMANFFDDAVQLTQRLKENYNIPILWGGIHPTLRPDECINYADMVCIGEGEEAIVELSNKMADGRYYQDVEGVWFKDKERIIKNPVRPLIKNLDHISFPDFDYKTHFILSDGSIQQMDIELLKRYMGRTYMTMPTRGCPFGCTYCCNNFLNTMYPKQKLPRKRSIDNIINELAEAIKLLPFIDCITFDDDSFFSFSLKTIEEFCEKYNKIGLPLNISGATPTTITREKLSLCVDAGLKFVRMGIQSGSERTKKLYNRRYTNKQVERAAKIINEFKDRTEAPQYDIILDNPWENEEDLIETLMLLSKLPTPYKLSLFSLNYFPGTELYKKAKSDGLITDDLKDIYRKDFHGCNKTYINSLFFLLNDYASNGLGISSKIILFLTNPRITQLKLHWPLFFVLKLLTVPLKLKKRASYLAYKGFKDVQNGDWSRIHNYIKHNLIR